MANNSCPVCMTKMRLHPDGHTKVCPECGYKLCDHKYTDRDLFDTDHSHNDYITFTENSNPVSSNYSMQQEQASRITDAPLQRTTPPNISAEDLKKKKLLRGIIIGYIIFILFIIFSQGTN